jgi:hypothetical protein
VFYHELSLLLRVGDRIAVKALQRAGSDMSSTALTMVAMKPYTRAVHLNYAKAGRAPMVRLSALALSDINMWRTMLMMSFSDTRWLSVSWHIPLHVARPRDESRDAWSQRMASVADFVMHSDAMCDEYRHGIGAVAATSNAPSTIFAWLGDIIPLDLVYVASDGTAKPFDINLLEALAVIVGFIRLVQQLMLLPPPSYPADSERPFVHVHLWCDNQAAMWWLTLNRTRSSFHLALFELYVQVQLLSGVVATIGYIPGFENTHADAASRNFQVTDGPAYLAALSAPAVQRWPASIDWISDLVQQCSVLSRDTFSSVPVGLTFAARLCSRPSA